jgi:hypothetical protein
MTSANERLHRRKNTMAFDHDDSVSRRNALERMIWASTGVLWMVSTGGSKSFG